MCSYLPSKSNQQGVATLNRVDNLSTRIFKNELSKNELKKINYEKSVELVKQVINEFDGSISSVVKNIERVKS